jgi:hypothetical protein
MTKAPIPHLTKSTAVAKTKLRRAREKGKRTRHITRKRKHTMFYILDIVVLLSMSTTHTRLLTSFSLKGWFDFLRLIFTKSMPNLECKRKLQHYISLICLFLKIFVGSVTWLKKTGVKNVFAFHFPVYHAISAPLCSNPHFS